MILTYRYRVKNLEGELNRQARAVNFVWNFCNDTQKHALKWGRKWPSAFDLMKLCAGSSKELGLASGTVDAICFQYVQSRKQCNRPHLRYRGKRSLGWVPLKGLEVKASAHGIVARSQEFKVFQSRPLPPVAKIRDGSSFARDARGNWFLNLAVEVPELPTKWPTAPVGIDLGLKDLAALSTGETIGNPRHYRAIEEKLGKAQRAGKRRQAKNLHAKAADARRDHHHKLSTRLVREFDYIAVGGVSSKNVAKTKMAKSVHDASWSSLRSQLRYKAITHGATYEEVNESLTSQTCSSCGSLPDSRPRGIAGLGIRRWVCSDCGADHDRDTNAALNILARSGHRALVEGAAEKRTCQMNKASVE